MSLAVDVKELTFSFPHSTDHALEDISISLPWNSRMLICGSNGAGKSTLLKLLSGKHLCRSGYIRVADRDPFATVNTALNEGMVTTYLGTEWCHMSIIDRDIGVLELLESIGLQHYHDRGKELIDILDVDVMWRMHRLSDGQKRRVQLCMGLLRPYKLLLLDEVTVDLDVVARAKLLKFLQHETETRQCSIIYATHIFDGLADWPHTIVHLSHGRILEKVDCARSIRFVKGEPGRSVEFTDPITIPSSHSIYPLAVEWLLRDEHKKL
ncbi:HDL524Cp [Eremothecium sinecaudum]|uniref:HDL524Cp n=1 Tax=Eremothecium sinecaudum TaxID=45286 RepID=A0A109UYQ7_9SACH|nr:HDL524Cp [Eremothecium sinecaudum]AMD20220.1 HDL524Cp [Eremothecium sinecaudum]